MATEEELTKIITDQKKEIKMYKNANEYLEEKVDILEQELNNKNEAIEVTNLEELQKVEITNRMARELSLQKLLGIESKYLRK